MRRTFKVIVADDEKLIARSISRRIEQFGGSFEVVAQAGTGLEALSLTRSLMPDVVFSDIKMPEMDGLELLSRLRETNPSILCVIVSGYSDFEYTRAAIQNSAVDYLLKPVNPEELNQLLRKLEATLLAREKTVIPGRELSASELVDHVMIYLRENYASQIDFSSIAEAHGVSAPYLSRLFHEAAGVSPSRYLTRCRMEHARKLLLDSRLSVREIALRVGYPDPFHFSKAFKNETGLSPSEFRENAGADT
jgi:Response regulator containing CheY-like receiver domain and AraC-type DNA-binding domain